MAYHSDYEPDYTDDDFASASGSDADMHGDGYFDDDGDGVENCRLLPTTKAPANSIGALPDDHSQYLIIDDAGKPMSAEYLDGLRQDLKNG
jgi:hypothetical protein